jgi:hypothetical protein
MRKFNVVLADHEMAISRQVGGWLGLSLAQVIRLALDAYWTLARALLRGDRVLVDRGHEVVDVLLPALDARAGRTDITPAPEEPS